MLVCFIIRIYHDARSSECQILWLWLIFFTCSRKIVLPFYNYFYSLRTQKIRRISSIRRLFSRKQWSTVTEYNTKNITFVNSLLSNAIAAMWLMCSTHVQLTQFPLRRPGSFHDNKLVLFRTYTGSGDLHSVLSRIYVQLFTLHNSDFVKCLSALPSFTAIQSFLAQIQQKWTTILFNPVCTTSL